MDRVNQYKMYAANLIREYAQYKPVNSSVDRQPIVDDGGGHYQLMSVGWRERQRIHHCVIHIDIINNKIWIQQNATDVDVANQLVEQGVPKEDIVLAFHPPSVRPFTGFGVN